MLENFVSIILNLFSMTSESQGGLYRNSGPGLYEFLMEAELQQYYTGIKGKSKVKY